MGVYCIKIKGLNFQLSFLDSCTFTKGMSPYGMLIQEEQ